MAKFPIQMSGVEVYDVEALKKHFDLDVFLQYRHKLVGWLKGADEEELALRVKALSADISNDTWLDKVAAILGLEAELKEARKKESECKSLAAVEAEQQEMEARKKKEFDLAVEKEIERRRLEEEKKRQRLAKKAERQHSNFPIVVNSTNCYCLNDLRENFSADAAALVRYRSQLYAWLQGAGEEKLAKQVKDLSPDLANSSWFWSVIEILKFDGENLVEAIEFWGRLSEDEEKERKEKDREERVKEIKERREWKRWEKVKREETFGVLGKIWNFLDEC